MSADGQRLGKGRGYRGIWYFNQPTGDEYVYKYSGGLGTYCAKHIPLAVHSPKAKRTFFCYGGRSDETNTLLHMVSYYDHESGLVPRPTILLDKVTDDAHDNPVLSVDGQGRVWVFSPAHGTARLSFIHRSGAPHSVEAFERTYEGNFSYPQPWYVPGRGFLFLHTRYTEHRRELYSSFSEEGLEWDDGRCLATMEKGHYQVSWRWKGKVGTAFNYHPDPGGLNFRTNLYYMETDDMGVTWRSASGERLQTPLISPANPALVRDYASEGRLVYLKDINFDREGRPVILYLTSGGWEPGPAGGPRVWHTARWTGESWDVGRITESDSNYDTGCLHIEGDGTWRLVAPTTAGPQLGNPGGEMVMWTSADAGASWLLARRLTSGSRANHTYARRPVDAHPGFYAFWADGDARRPSDSRLYFCTRDGSVYRLPERMEADFAEPESLG